MRLTRCAIAMTVLLAAWGAPARQDDPRLDELFANLAASSDFASSNLYAEAIWRVWLVTGDDELDQLMREGVSAMERGAPELAYQRFDAVIERAPDYAEALNKRATLHFLMGRLDDSTADVQRTLALEPRHFGALEGLGQIHEILDQPERALDAYRRALGIHPQLLLAKERSEAIRSALGREHI